MVARLGRHPNRQREDRERSRINKHDGKIMCIDEPTENCTFGIIGCHAPVQSLGVSDKG